MPYDEGLAQRVREVLEDVTGLSEKKMFGGLCFMLNGNMCCGVAGEELMLRVGPDAYEDAVSQPHARKMDFTGRPMKGFVFVEPDGIASDKDLNSWVAKASAFALSLPAK